MSIQIIATIGPRSLKLGILEKFYQRHVDFIRLNLSHTEAKNIESCLLIMKKSKIPIIIDTEGSQIRTGSFGSSYLTLSEGDKIRIYQYPVRCSKAQIYIRPTEAVRFLHVGSLISIDFNSVLLKVESTKINQGYVECGVLNGGVIGNNKAVSIDDVYTLPAFSQKDIEAIHLAKKYGVSYFTLSYIGHENEVSFFKKLYPQAIAYSKIETKRGLQNFEKILKVSDGILIDRGDLSREISFEKIPFVQKRIIQRCRAVKKDVFVATHILESMCENLSPVKSEVNDVVNTLLDGTSGFVLTKETAIGKYPVETVNVLKSLIHYSNQNYLKDDHTMVSDMANDMLIEPHGGKLVNGIKRYEFTERELKVFKRIYVSDYVLMDAEQIALGAFSPLEGFVNSQDLESILNEMRLTNKLPWPMPIIFSINQDDFKKIREKETIALVRKKDRRIYATLLVEEIFKIDKENLCKRWFGTNHLSHPGVYRIMAGGDYCLSGKVNLLRRLPTPHKHHELTPFQTRKIFKEKGWSLIVGFHTRNPIHRSHEYIQLKALQESHCDGLFVHPVIGHKKSGDFESDIIVKSYEIMRDSYYPKKKVVMGVFLTYPRYAGPREAMFTAICRQNFGCSHFIVGRDHAGLGTFYSQFSSQEIFKKFPELNIKPIFFKEIYYSKKHKEYKAKNIKEDAMKHQAYSMSGANVRHFFSKNKQPPSWLMRPEISKMIMEEKLQGNKIFVEG